MSIKCQVTGEIPYNLSPGDKFLITFDISSWLGTDEISSVAYSATDENGVAATVCFDSDLSQKTTTVFKPYIKAGDVDNKKYTLKCLVTTMTSYLKAFYVIIPVNEGKAKKS
jgi:hypothetical protein